MSSRNNVRSVADNHPTTVPASPMYPRAQVHKVHSYAGKHALEEVPSLSKAVWSGSRDVRPEEKRSESHASITEFVATCFFFAYESVMSTATSHGFVPISSARCIHREASPPLSFPLILLSLPYGHEVVYCCYRCYSPTWRIMRQP